MKEPRQFKLQRGSEVIFQGHRYRITHVLDLNKVLLMHVETQEVVQAPISEIHPCSAKPKQTAARSDLIAIKDAEWDIARRRFEIIHPLLDPKLRTRDAVRLRAHEYDLHTNTLYRWIAQYENHELLSSLIPKECRSDKGKIKLPPEVEVIIQSVIDKEYLSSQKKSKQAVYVEICRLCDHAELPIPHLNTVRNRMAHISEETQVARRHGRKAADEQFKPIEGEFPGADWPLSVWQIDHTKVDLILVDDIYRRPIGRPWITMSIDVYSRMVTGFYISFDPPGALATGLCLVHSILPKETWLAGKEVQGEWPCWGLPAKIHMDNAKEFRGKMLQRACQQYGIDIEWRPIARPNFGGHIERLMGTTAEEIHTLPGTTFSNTKERSTYDSEGKAVITLSEFEQWLTEYIVNIYHARIHSALKMPPVAKFRQGLLGTKEKPGVGLPARITDEARLRLDFMPYEERTIQDYGVVIEEIHYYHDVLRRWINAVDPENRKVKRKFMFRQDPRNISVIWFFDPELNIYFDIPYRDITRPAITIWEMREAKRILASEGAKHVDERAIFNTYGRMRELVEKSKGHTVAARRSEQRKAKEKPTSTNRDNPYASTSNATTDIGENTELPAQGAKILPFEDLDDMIP